MSASKQTGIDALMRTGSFSGSSLAIFSLFFYDQAYGREDYRHCVCVGQGGGGGRGELSQCRTRYSQEVTCDPQRTQK